jgi:hypothetical protein
MLKVVINGSVPAEAKDLFCQIAKEEDLFERATLFHDQERRARGLVAGYPLSICNFNYCTDSFKVTFREAQDRIVGEIYIIL